jgi:hypothetical protein
MSTCKQGKYSVQIPNFSGQACVKLLSEHNNNPKHPNTHAVPRRGLHT